MALHYTNTEFERMALANPVNLSDGHARQTMSAEQRAIFAKTSSHLEEVQSRSQVELEAEFVELFLRCAGQARPWDDRCQYLNYSASSALSLAAQLCRWQGRRAVLIEPCFDNIRHLLTGHGVAVEAISEEALANPEQLADCFGPDVMLWIVQPNNPTGFCLDQVSFERLIAMLSDRGAGLVVDFTFRFFASSLYNWRQYDQLDAASIDYIGIEDTGKTWAAADLKVGMTLCSRSLAPLVHQLHDQLLLNISPLTLVILREFLRDSERRGVSSAVRIDVDHNRDIVRQLIDGGLLDSATRTGHNVPLELLALPSERDAIELWRALRSRGVDILPASNYYWSVPDLGSAQFRIPLSRPRSAIYDAVSIMTEILRGTS